MSIEYTVSRGGLYYRVVAPNWINPADTSYSKRQGGRWNSPGEFGVLYLNAEVHVAAANARAQHAGRAIKLFDLLPKARPELVTFDVPQAEVLDACTQPGIAALGFMDSFPYQVTWLACQTVAREAHAAGLSGIAARSHAEITATAYVGEELALFEESSPGPPIARRSFQEWYPDPIAG